VPPLTPAQEDLYRERVKRELKSEFDRCITLQADIEACQGNLARILEEPCLARLLDQTYVSLRLKDSLNDTLKDRLERFNHLVGRIFRDLDITTVYPGPQQPGALGGRISSMAMADMVRGYFTERSRNSKQPGGGKPGCLALIHDVVPGSAVDWLPWLDVLHRPPA